MLKTNITVILDGDNLIYDTVEGLNIGEGLLYGNTKNDLAIVTLVMRDHNSAIKSIDLPSDTTIKDLLKECDKLFEIMDEDYDR